MITLQKVNVAEKSQTYTFKSCYDASICQDSAVKSLIYDAESNI